MPQWDFLDFIAEHGRRYSTFHLKLQAEVVDRIEEPERVVGVRVKTPEGPVEVRAELIVGADGRHSIVRERAGLEVQKLGAPIDVLWFRLSRKVSDPDQTLGRFVAGKIMVMLNRGDYWQCGIVIPKGNLETLQNKRLPAFRDDIVAIAPFLVDRVAELREWTDTKLLTVIVDRLREWYRPGLLCIGDAAHAMSPIGGVGINLAIQDAVAAANVLVRPLSEQTISVKDLAKIQDRRQPPTRITQGLQVFLQERVIRAVLVSDRQISLPWPLKLFQRWSLLRRFPGRMIGIGFRPEHIKTPDTFKGQAQA